MDGRRPRSGHDAVGPRCPGEPPTTPATATSGSAPPKGLRLPLGPRGPPRRAVQPLPSSATAPTSPPTGRPRFRNDLFDWHRHRRSHSPGSAVPGVPPLSWAPSSPAAGPPSWQRNRDARPGPPARLLCARPLMIAPPLLRFHDRLPRRPPPPGRLEAEPPLSPLYTRSRSRRRSSCRFAIEVPIAPWPAPPQTGHPDLGPALQQRGAVRAPRSCAAVGAVGARSPSE